MLSSTHTQSVLAELIELWMRANPMATMLGAVASKAYARNIQELTCIKALSFIGKG